jgi:histone H3/H4
MTAKTQNSGIIKKKKSRFFEIYISKLLKNISDNGITLNAKEQFNSILCFITKIIADKSYDITVFSGKKTISEKEIRNTLKFILPENLSKSSILNGQKAFDSFSSTENRIKGTSRQERSSIIFPPSIVERFLRNFGNNKIMVTSNAPIFLAGAIENIAFELLENATIQAKGKKHIRITVRDLELGIQNDKELSSFFSQHKIYLLGGGITPYIHPNLLVKKPKKKTIIKDTEEERKKHRYRPGTVSIREMKKLQKNSNILSFARLPFEKLVRQIVQNHTNEKIKISKDVFITLQYFIEQRLIQILQQANFATIHANRLKLLPIDINFIMNIKQDNGNPYKNNTNSSELLELNTSYLKIPFMKIKERQDDEEDEVNDEEDEVNDDEDDEVNDDKDDEVNDDEDEVNDDEDDEVNDDEDEVNDEEDEVNDEHDDEDDDEDEEDEEVNEEE